MIRVPSASSAVSHLYTLHQSSAAPDGNDRKDAAYVVPVGSKPRAQQVTLSEQAGDSPGATAESKTAAGSAGEGPAGSPGPNRRLSLAGGIAPAKTISQAEDAKRRRLSVATIPSQYARQVVEDNRQEGMDPKTPVRGPDGGRKAVQLPVVWGQYSRPGNDPMKRTKENQDSFIVVDAYANVSDQMLFSVCDGHGPMGAHASAFVTRHLPASWDTELLAKQPFLAMNQGCLKTNQQLSVSGIDVYVSGTTCIASYLKGNVLHVANVGDSRAVLGRMETGGTIRAIDLSHDQKPDRPDEMARIVSSGGRVFEWGVPRVWLKDADMPGLAMARSFGDLAAETVGVYAEPELARVELGEQDKFAIWASDGIWEFISSQEAVDIVAERGSLGPQACCDALVKESTRRWNQEEDVVDDTTVIVAFFAFGTTASARSSRKPPVRRAGSQRAFMDENDTSGAPERGSTSGEQMAMQSIGSDEEEERYAGGGAEE